MARKRFTEAEMDCKCGWCGFAGRHDLKLMQVHAPGLLGVAVLVQTCGRCGGELEEFLPMKVPPAKVAPKKQDRPGPPVANA